jgi:hypothetical protein
MTGRASGYNNWITAKPLPRGTYPQDPELPIPDNSDSSKYFDTNHITVSIYSQGKSTEFSIWDNDSENYRIEYCNGATAPDAKDVKLMRGGGTGGNNAKIALHIFEPQPGNYQLTAIRITDAEERKKIEVGFKGFKEAANMRPGSKYTHAQLNEFMKHEAFKSVNSTAAEAQYKSVGLVMGGGGGLVVGGDAFKGAIRGTSDTDSSYSITSVALSVGTQEGVVAFVGLYLSTEEPANVGGWEFFYEVAAALGIGFAIRHFATISGELGMMVLTTTGEELELSVGVGDTTATKMA